MDSGIAAPDDVRFGADIDQSTGHTTSYMLGDFSILFMGAITVAACASRTRRRVGVLEFGSDRN